MIPLITRLWRAFWHDEMFAARWARGFLLWLGSMAAQVVAAGLEVAERWTLRQWVLRLVVAAVVGAAGLINLGQPNPKKEAGAVTLWGLAVLMAIGWGIFLYAQAHLGVR